MEHQHCPFCGGTRRLQRSDSLHGGTDGDWRSETEDKVPPGFKFNPTDWELMVYYLIPFALGWGNPPVGDHVVREQVYEKEPRELLGPNRDKRYFLTTRTMHGKRVKRTVGDGKGTWSVTMGRNSICSELGWKTTLSYSVSKKSAGYTMDEYEVSQDYINKNYYRPEDLAQLQELVLCCVRRVKRDDSEQGPFEIGGEYRDCKRRAVVVAATAAAAEGITFSPENAAVAIGVTTGNCSARPLQIYGADCSATQLPMDSFAAAEASPEGRAHTEATNFDSGNQIMPSSAADRRLPRRSSSRSTEEIFNAMSIYTTKRTYEHGNFFEDLAGIGQHHSGQPSGQDWQTFFNSEYSPQPLAPEL